MPELTLMDDESLTRIHNGMEHDAPDPETWRSMADAGQMLGLAQAHDALLRFVEMQGGRGDKQIAETCADVVQSLIEEMMRMAR